MTTLDLRGLSVSFAARGGGTHQALAPVNLQMRVGRLRRRASARRAAARPRCCRASPASSIRTDGEILLDGRAVVGPGADRGVVFQKHALMPWLTVRDNVEFGLRMRGVPKDQRMAVVRDKLRAVGLEKYIDYPVYQLSGGMQQRVGIARALASDPAVLLMDEPLGALDALTRETVQETILKLWAAENKMVFFITHDGRGSAVPRHPPDRDEPSPGAHRARVRPDVRPPVRRERQCTRGEVGARVHPHARGSASA